MGQIPEKLRAALGGGYELERVIGQGGMATVYLAQDLKHSRKVAIKVLRPELAAVIGADRFLREIEIAAGLNHPHILPLHDSCDTDGCLHYVMPFVDGESLRELITRERRVDVPRALAITSEVADALDYAHRKGIVHRDIKPENILLSEGHAVVADFGIAKAVRTAGGENLTKTGFPLGTPGYMSPEQAAGLMDLDKTTDIYSLGCVFYEMATGAPPEMWPTEEATRLGRFVDASPEHREILDGLPGRFEQVLTRAMAFRSRDRFASPVELSEALQAAYKDRSFVSEGNAKEIVKRAADLQYLQPTQEGALSLGGVEQIAAQVGIPPSLVNRAARSLDAPAKPGEVNQFLGASTIIQFDRVVEGEFPEVEYADLVEVLRTTIGNVGSTSSLRGSLTWNTPSASMRDVHFTISSRGGQSRIVIQERLNNLAGGLFGGLMGGLGGGGGTVALTMGIVFGGGPVGVVAMGAVVGGAYGLARAIFRKVAKKRSEQLEDLIERISEHVRKISSSPKSLQSGRD